MFEDMDDDSNNFEQTTPLMHAVINGHKDMVEKLIHNNCDVNAQDINGETALTLVIDGGYSHCHDMVKILIEAKANLHIPNCHGMTPLLLASKWSDETSFDLLLKSNEDFSNDLKSALFYAARGNDMNQETYLQENFIEKLVSLGADVNWQDKETGSTPLIELIKNDADWAIAKLMTYDNIDLSIKNNNEFDCFNIAHQFDKGHLVDLINASLEEKSLSKTIKNDHTANAVLNF